MKKLSEDRFLADLFTKDAVQANFLQRIVDAVNNVAKGAGVAVSGEHPAPPPVNAITVKANGEMVHATLTHNAEVNRAINYFIEADTNKSFTQPHVMDIGSSRTHVFHLPALNDSGAQQPWYLRAYAQYPGSKPSTPTVLGGLTNPTPVPLVGSTKLTLLPSTGSGTGSSTGQQGAAGRGKQRVSTPKAVRIGKSQASSAPVTPPVVSAAPHLLAAVTTAASTTSISQHSTTTQIDINGNQVFHVGGVDVTMFGDPVDPGSFGTYYIYADNPSLTSGRVKFVATTDITDLGKAPGRFPVGKITTAGGGGGSGGGSGGGGGCFTGNVGVLTPKGIVPFRNLGTIFEIKNETGIHRAKLVTHHGWFDMLDMGGDNLVTLKHRLKVSGEWMPAEDYFGGSPAIGVFGTVYNLHVVSDNPEDHHYILENGMAAHNFNKF